MILYSDYYQFYSFPFNVVTIQLCHYSHPDSYDYFNMVTNVLNCVTVVTIFRLLTKKVFGSGQQTSLPEGRVRGTEQVPTDCGHVTGLGRGIWVPGGEGWQKGFSVHSGPAFHKCRADISWGN